MLLAVIDSKQQVAAGCGPKQFGCGRPNGAQQEIAEVRAAARAFPDRCFLSLDVKNAFGQVSWHRALQAATTRAPKLAKALVAAWTPGGVDVFVERPRGEPGPRWVPFATTGSVVQGNLEGSPSFSLALAEALTDLENEMKAAGSWAHLVRIWVYVDDIVIQAPPEVLPAVFAAAKGSLGRHGFPLQPSKCAVHLPSHLGKTVADLPHTLQELIAEEGLQWMPQGIILLGTEATQEKATPLHVTDEVPQATLDRKTKAVKLADKLEQLLLLAPPAGAKQAVFTMARVILCHALDFDAGVLPSRILLPHTSALDECILRLVAATLDLSREDLPQRVCTQLCLPRSLGGLQLTLPSRTAPLARVAGVLATGPAVRQAIASWAELHPEMSFDSKALDGIDHEAAELENGLHTWAIPGIDGTGMPTTEKQEESFRPLAPSGHLLSAYLQYAGLACWQKWYDEGSDRDKVRILSCGGPTAGKSLVSMLGPASTHFADWQWTSAARWRLGLTKPPANAICHNVKQNGEQCKEALDEDHAAECPCGPLRTRRHNDLAEDHAQFIEEAGGLARMEVYVPEMSTAASNRGSIGCPHDSYKKPAMKPNAAAASSHGSIGYPREFCKNSAMELNAAAASSHGSSGYPRDSCTKPAMKPHATWNGEAWLDVWGYGVCEYPDILLDIRVAHPNAVRYLPKARVTAGHAAAVGELEKHDRYPKAKGRDIIPVIHESWGRIGAEGDICLETLAAAARRRAHRRGRDSTTTLSRWREKLDGTLHKAVAVQLAAATHGLPGKRPYRRAPADLAGLEAGAAV